MACVAISLSLSLCETLEVRVAELLSYVRHGSLFRLPHLIRMHYPYAPFVPIDCCKPHQATFTSFFVKQVVDKSAKEETRTKAIVRAASIPSLTEQPVPQAVENPDFLKPSLNSTADPADSVSQIFWESSRGGKWLKDNESALCHSEPLPLPMTYPGSTPSAQDVEDMKNCDPEIKDCQDVIYQWTGECSRCQGTGAVSYHRGNGREVEGACISCLGLGHVHKVTLRTDIDIVEEMGLS